MLLVKYSESEVIDNKSIGAEFEIVGCTQALDQLDGHRPVYSSHRSEPHSRDILVELLSNIYGSKTIFSLYRAAHSLQLSESTQGT